MYGGSCLEQSLAAHVYDKVVLLTPDWLICSFHPLGYKYLWIWVSVARHQSGRYEAALQQPKCHPEERVHLKMTRRKLALNKDPGTGSQWGRQLSHQAYAWHVTGVGLQLVMGTNQILSPIVISHLDPGVGKAADLGEQC